MSDTGLRKAFPLLLALTVALCALQSQAQQQRYWVGGSGAWHDKAHWSAMPGGAGGASVPKLNDAVTIAPAGGEVRVNIGRNAEAGDLLIDGGRAVVVLEGSAGRLRITGNLAARGSVAWTFPGTVDCAGGEGVRSLDLRGTAVGGPMRLTGPGQWQMQSDLVLADGGTLDLAQATLATQGNMLRAGTLGMGQGSLLQAANSVVMLGQFPVGGLPSGQVRPTRSRLLVGGVPMEWGHPEEAGEERAQNVCATGTGQTPFTIDAQLMSNYNGFGVSCHGVCNGQVRVVVTGGVGPFVYNWVGGPASATWNNVCPGNQIVIVTDQGQGVSCATTVQVTDPALLSVIFMGVVPPTCAGVCNGSATGFAVGGVPGYTYSWNSGAGSGSTFNALCAGNNTLHVQDVNGCTFDTVFRYPILPISPNLTVADAQCANSCSGTATAAPTGGTGVYTYNWGPGNPAGNGTPTVSGLCAGNYTLTISDANGCDTTLQFQVTEPPPIVPNATHVNARCGNLCNGSASVAPTGGGGTYTYAWTPQPGAGQGTAHATGLCKGTYTVLITDVASGCDTLVPIFIDAPPLLLPNPSSTPITCADACDGTATVAPSGGTTPYSYTWSPAPPVGQFQPTASQLCAGTWSVTVRDWANCDTTVQFNIQAPPPIEVNASKTDVACAGECNGSASAPATGGSGTLTYLWQPGNPAGQGTPDATGLCAGNWSVTITDANGCDTTVLFVIEEPLPMALDPQQTDVTCGGICDGTAHVAVQGGTAPFAYQWTPAPAGGQGTATATGLCPGTWAVEVTDANGCQETQTFNILPAVPMQVALQLEPVSCPGICDGEATATVGGGVAPYSYSWVPAPAAGQGSPHATGLCAGPGTLTVMDALGCDTTIAFTIQEPPALEAHATVTPPHCASDCDGSIVLAPTGGSGSYTYNWAPVPPNGNGTPQATGLCTGSYTVVITSGGCDTTMQFTMQAPPPIAAIPAQTDVSCAGACDGTASAPATGGTGVLTYLWQPGNPNGQGTSDVADLCAGTWSVTISDENGCDTTIQFVINEPAPMDLVPSQTNVSCSSNCDGTATIAVSGGTAPHSYNWAPGPGGGQGTPEATGLCAGTWTVAVTDANGCREQHSFTILPAVPMDVVLQLDPASCPGVCDGAAEASVAGGAPGYTWTWAPAPAAGQGTPNATGLCPGPGSLTVRDALGCDTTITFNIPEPPALEANATVTDPTCPGDCNGSIVLAASGGAGTYAYNWIPVPPNGNGTAQATGLCAGDHTVVISSWGCDSTFTFTLLPPPAIDVALSTTPANCWNSCDGSAEVNGDLTGLDFQWNPVPGAGQGTPNASGLCPGAGSVTVTNAAGCDTVLTFIIPAPLPITVGADVVNASCGSVCDGSIGLTVSGGTGGYSFLWSPVPGAGQGTPTATQLCPGNYTVTIGDANGCDTTLHFTIDRPQPINPTATLVPASCADRCDGAIDASATGGLPPYTWTWSPAPGMGQGTPVASSLCPGTWQLTIGDQAGCDTTVTFTLNAPPAIEPNGSFTHESCNGPCDGTATVAPTGGSGNFTFLWSPAPPQGQGTATASGLCPGDWCVQITDASGCDTTWCFTILPHEPISAQLDVVDGGCWGSCTGQVTANASGGAGGYGFLWNPAPAAGQGTATATGLCEGAGTVTITDAQGCSSTFNFTISNAAPIVPDLLVSGESCTAACSGSAVASPAGGNGGFLFHWEPAPASGQGTPQAEGLCAGTNYQLTITDASGCDTTITFTVPPFEPIVALVDATDATCWNTCDGTASVATPTGGAPPYTYTWDPAPAAGQGTAQATGLCPGAYTVTVTDQDGCSTDVPFQIGAPAPITVQATLGPISCGSACTGTIDLAVSGGTGNHGFLWNPQPGTGQGTASVGQLCAGIYAVTISDDAGCVLDTSFTVVEPQALAAVAVGTQSHCGQCDGTVAIHTTGGTAPLMFHWASPISVDTPDSVMVGLCAGIYVVKVEDAAGCLITLAAGVSDEDGEQVQAVDGVTTCPGDCDGTVAVDFNCGQPPCIVEWTDALGNPLATGVNTLDDLCAGDYLVAVTNALGCTTVDTATVISPQPFTANISSSPVSCAGQCDGAATIDLVGGSGQFSYTWTPAPGGGQGGPHATGLCAGPYDVLVQDLSGCAATFSVLILGPDPLTVDAVITPIACANECNGLITLDVQGGTGPYTYAWSPAPPAGQGTSEAKFLCDGSYSVTVTDAHGCDTTLTFNLAGPLPLAVAPTATLSHCAACDGSATANSTGGTGNIAVEWTRGGVAVGTGETLTGLCAGIYTVTVTDENGCSTSAAVAVPDANGEDIQAVNSQTLCGNSCDGAVAVNYACTDAPCTVQWTTMAGDLLGDQDQLTGLCPGSYIVLVTNAGGCTAMDTAHVVPSQVITPNATATPVTCHNLCDGTATVAPGGGVAPYTFTWTPAPGAGQGTAQATGLCPGQYTVLIADQSGCDTLVQVDITAPAPILLDIQVQEVSCAGGNNGSIVVTPSGGAGFYSYDWNPVPPNGQGSNSALNIPAGQWSVTVTDLNGCDTTVAIDVSEPAPLTASISSTESDCAICNGTASVSVGGGIPPYSYSWALAGAPMGNDADLTGLCTGIYTVLVTDINGCSINLTVPVQDADGEQLTATGTGVSCPGICDGTAQVAFSCSGLTCTVAWFDADGNDLGQSGNTITGLCAGIYYVQVTNDVGCTSIEEVEVASPAPIVPNLGTTPVSCPGACDGVAIVGPTGGAGGYVIEWDIGGTTVQGPEASGLCTGNYTATITDADGCTVMVDALITAPDPIDPTAVSTPITCNGACDGTIAVSVAGGTAPFTYAWSPAPPNGQGTSTVQDLCAGDWTVTVTDANGCNAATTVQLPEPPLLTIDLTSTNNACHGDCSATAQVDVQGGAAPYNITWTGPSGVIGQHVAQVAGLCAGAYQVSVTDDHGCVVTADFTVTEGTEIEGNLAVLGESCFGPCDGSASVAPTGGSGSGYNIVWAPGNPAGQGTDEVTGLCAGDFTVTITDGSGCSTELEFTILPFEPIDAHATVVDATCQGTCDGSILLSATGGSGTLQYTWNPQPATGQGTPTVEGLCAGAWSVTIADAAGCDSTFTFNVDEPAALVLTVESVVPASCNNAADGEVNIGISGGTPGYIFAWQGPGGFQSADQNIAGLLPGTYTLTVTDAALCSITSTVELPANNPLVADAGPDQVLCPGAEVVLDGGGSIAATSFQWSDLQGHVAGGAAVVDLGPLAPGNYTYVLTVADGPCTASDTVHVTVLEAAFADAGPGRAVYVQGTTVLGGSPSGPAGSVFTWQPDSLLDHGTVANPTATVHATTWFYLTVVAPNGCSAMDSVLVTVVPEVKVPSGFTPNGDGHNDTWILDFASLFPNIEVQVFNRWGEPLFRSVGYHVPWDGKYDGRPVPMGTYYYVVDLHDERFPEALTGPLTVIR